MDTNDEFKFRRGAVDMLLLACGALGKEIIAVVEANKLTHLDVTCLPAHLHHTPDRIVPALKRKLDLAAQHYQRVIVLYGDCGTGGKLDELISEYVNVSRIDGPHCFSFFMGNKIFEKQSDDELGTFYLTDYFCRHFETFVWDALGLDRRADMVDFVFGNYKRLLFIPQTKDAELEMKAREIAIRLKLKYEYRFAGYGDMESRLLAT